MARRKSEVAWADPTLLILGSLAAGPKHGYAIILDTKENADITLGPGTLYGALARLEERGLVRALPGQERRRPYEITAAGAALLAARLKAMRSFSAHGLARLRTARP
ncbi:PadR family transcriptional regulator [Arthrobacter livingstonensis]|uniref:PadR family transcriptional regulator n=1 Tax=Arthrobacter livingstonensis TaxID=670078 RepID=A0A2V5L5L3_9MICC|nr:PadR family transcriptional regulator [Arthrobacter livingstonensis]PYI65464.1 PadR family transcriptional regulator [Arthrobacter livingstonensis]